MRKSARRVPATRIVSTVLLLAVITSFVEASSPATEEAKLYPVYEGWTRNPDGSATLVFGYYNHSAEPIELAPGPANGFDPAPDDRGQPVLFLPGRQRNVCRMVVPAGFEGNLKWRLEYQGVSVATTELGGLDPLYLLEEIGSAYRSTREIDHESVVRGVCLNGAPTVRAARALSAAVSVPTELRGLVEDDGLPRGSSVVGQWRQKSGPADASFENAGIGARVQVTFPAAGVYVLELSASDGEASADALVEVTVAE